MKTKLFLFSALVSISAVVLFPVSILQNSNSVDQVNNDQIISTYNNETSTTEKFSGGIYTSSIYSGYNENLLTTYIFIPVKNGTTTDWEVFVTGSNDYGQYGNNTTVGSSTPVNVTDEWEQAIGKTFSDVGIKNFFTDGKTSFLFLEDGSIYAWGNDENGTMGNGAISSNLDQPTLVDFSVYGLDLNQSTSFHINSGSVITFVDINSDGINDEVWGWGDNNYGTLGEGSTASEFNAPIELTSYWNKVGSNLEVSNIEEFYMIGGTSFAFTKDGKFYSWGDNENYLVNSSIEDAILSPQKQNFLTSTHEIKNFVVGENYVIAFLENGQVIGWGNNENSQLTLDPVQNPFLSQPTDITSSFTYQLANTKQVISLGDTSITLLTDGTVWGWGNNDAFQMSNGTTTDIQTPQQLQFGNISDPIESIYPTQDGWFISTQNDYLYAAGSNVSGQLGTNSNTTLSPVNLTDISEWNISPSIFSIVADVVINNIDNNSIVIEYKYKNKLGNFNISYSVFDIASQTSIVNGSSKPIYNNFSQKNIIEINGLEAYRDYQVTLTSSGGTQTLFETTVRTAGIVTESLQVFQSASDELTIKFDYLDADNNVTNNTVWYKVVYQQDGVWVEEVATTQYIANEKSEIVIENLYPAKDYYVVISGQSSEFVENYIPDTSQNPIETGVNNSFCFPVFIDAFFLDKNNPINESATTISVNYFWNASVAGSIYYQIYDSNKQVISMPGFSGEFSVQEAITSPKTTNETEKIFLSQQQYWIRFSSKNNQFETNNATWYEFNTLNTVQNFTIETKGSTQIELNFVYEFATPNDSIHQSAFINIENVTNKKSLKTNGLVIDSGWVNLNDIQQLTEGENTIVLDGFIEKNSYSIKVSTDSAGTNMVPIYDENGDEITSPIYMPNFIEWWWWIILALTVVIIILIVYYLLSRNKRREEAINTKTVAQRLVNEDLSSTTKEIEKLIKLEQLEEIELNNELSSKTKQFEMNSQPTISKQNLSIIKDLPTEKQNIETINLNDGKTIQHTQEYDMWASLVLNKRDRYNLGLKKLELEKIILSNKELLEEQRKISSQMYTREMYFDDSNLVDTTKQKTIVENKYENTKHSPIENFGRDVDVIRHIFKTRYGWKDSTVDKLFDKMSSNKISSKQVLKFLSIDKDFYVENNFSKVWEQIVFLSDKNQKYKN